jgi:uncharacterized membrane protein SirB2
MIHIHLFLALAVIAIFVWRFYLTQTQSALMNQSWMKLLPHALAGTLILSGIALIIERNWLSAAYGWIVMKIVLMLAFIGLGIVSLKTQGQTRWLAFAGALYCFAYVVRLAVAKQWIWFF